VTASFGFSTSMLPIRASRTGSARTPSAQPLITVPYGGTSLSPLKGQPSLPLRGYLQEGARTRSAQSRLPIRNELGNPRPAGAIRVGTHPRGSPTDAVCRTSDLSPCGRSPPASETLTRVRPRLAHGGYAVNRAKPMTPAPGGASMHRPAWPSPSATP
jgi:hypothetical protein